MPMISPLELIELAISIRAKRRTSKTSGNQTAVNPARRNGAACAARWPHLYGMVVSP
jgi:hypothetical protein